MPEVEQFDDIMRSVYTDFCLTKLKGQLRTVVSWEQALMTHLCTDCIEAAEAGEEIASIATPGTFFPG